MIASDISHAVTNREWKLPKHILPCSTIRHLHIVQYRQQSDLAFMLLVKSQNLDEPLGLDELMRYSLTPVPLSLGTADGFFNKTNKAALLHFFTDDSHGDIPYPKGALHIQDGNTLFHALTNISPTFGEICLQVLDQMVAKKDFIFSTDSYHADSIKAQERLRRGSSQRYLIQGPGTRKPNDFKLFPANDHYKTQLCVLLFKVWSSNDAASRMEHCGTALVVVNGKAYQLQSSDGDVAPQEVHELTSNQEETDTRIVLYLKYAAKLGYKSAVVRTPDTDIFVILLFHYNTIGFTIFLDIGTGKHRQMVNKMVLGLYVFTGEDITSSFKGKGKIGPLKKLQRHPIHHEAFRKLGDEWSVEPETIDDIEAFTCLMYGYSRQKSIDTVRRIMLRKMVGEDEQLTTKSKIDLSHLPPCRDNLMPHIRRVNHRLAIYKRAYIPIFWSPKPYNPEQGWEQNHEGVLEPVWSCRLVLPPALIDLVHKTTKEMEQCGDDPDGEQADQDSDNEELLSDNED
ncbi:uncharacterized protein [Palaemon carinicauda]|uniref:uncharacterized protein n=1 Tax=Palaemon carinicauda TaxID=392227 RepID=UPI0035B5B9DE